MLNLHPTDRHERSTLWVSTLYLSHKTDSGLVKIAQFEESRRQTTPRSPCTKSTKPQEGELVKENDIEEGALYVKVAILVFNGFLLPELSHKETDAGARGADHLGQRVLGDLRNDRLQLAVFPIAGHQQEDPRQPLLGRIEEMINQVRLDTHIARQQIGHKQCGEARLFVKHTDHGRLLNAHD